MDDMSPPPSSLSSPISAKGRCRGSPQRIDDIYDTEKRSILDRDEEVEVVFPNEEKKEEEKSVAASASAADAPAASAVRRPPRKMPLASSAPSATTPAGGAWVGTAKPTPPSMARLLLTIALAAVTVFASFRAGRYVARSSRRGGSVASAPPASAGAGEEASSSPSAVEAARGTYRRVVARETREVLKEEEDDEDSSDDESTSGDVINEKPWPGAAQVLMVDVDGLGLDQAAIAILESNGPMAAAEMLLERIYPILVGWRDEADTEDRDGEEEDDDDDDKDDYGDIRARILSQRCHAIDDDGSESGFASGAHCAALMSGRTHLFLRLDAPSSSDNNVGGVQLTLFTAITHQAGPIAALSRPFRQALTGRPPLPPGSAVTGIVEASKELLAANMRCAWAQRGRGFRPNGVPLTGEYDMMAGGRDAYDEDMSEMFGNLHVRTVEVSSLVGC